MTTVVTPCRGYGRIYDTAVNRRAQAARRRQARIIAAGLCASCPLAATCDYRVTRPGRDRSRAVKRGRRARPAV